MNNYGKMIFDSCKKENVNRVRYYIRKGGDVNYQNELGQTPLMVASSVGSKEIARILIKNGADIKIENYFGCTAEIMAHSSCNKEMPRIINKKETALQTAIV